jgi:hypothetical protein
LDLTEDIIYRGFKLNDRAIGDNLTGGGETASGIFGCVVDSVDFSDTDVVQFIEKRSQQDGMDAGDVFLGTRRVRMAGTLYHVTRALLFDALWELRAAMSPVLAQRESPLDRGYCPLYFSTPTNRIEEYDTAAIDLRMLALPRSFQAMIARDAMGGEETDSLAIPWQATFICKDPSIMGATPQDYDIDAGGTVRGDILNRGSYLCPVNMLIVTGSGAGTIACSVGDSVFTIGVPASTGARTFRFKGEDKVLTVEEADVEVPRMDLITFSGDATWPLVSHGTSPYTITYSSVTPAAGSHMWMYERYA